MTSPVTRTSPRMAAILAAFAHAPSLTVGEVAAATGIPASAVYRHLPILVDTGLVSPARSRGRYCAGSLTVQLAANYKHQMLSRGAVTQRLRQLAQDTSELAAYLVPHGNRIVCVEAADGPHAIRCAFSPGASQPLLRGASAHAVLAHLPAERVDAMAAEYGLEPADVADLRRELRAVRDRGHAISVGALDDGVWGVAVPVFAGGGQVSAVVSTMAPEFRVRPSVGNLIALTHAAAEDISRFEEGPA